MQGLSAHQATDDALSDKSSPENKEEREGEAEESGNEISNIQTDSIFSSYRKISHSFPHLALPGIHFSGFRSRRCIRELWFLFCTSKEEDMYNKIILIGNLTKDPELKYTPQGTPVTSFRIAVNSRLSQEKQENLFIDIIAFGRVAETSNEYLTKGSSVLVEGGCMRGDGRQMDSHVLNTRY